MGIYVVIPENVEQIIETWLKGSSDVKFVVYFACLPMQNIIDRKQWVCEQQREPSSSLKSFTLHRAVVIQCDGMMNGTQMRNTVKLKRERGKTTTNK